MIFKRRILTILGCCLGLLAGSPAAHAVPIAAEVDVEAESPSMPAVEVPDDPALAKALLPEGGVVIPRPADKDDSAGAAGSPSHRIAGPAQAVGRSEGTTTRPVQPEFDPLSAALRGVVNRTPGDSGGIPPAASESNSFEEGVKAPILGDDEELQERIHGVREGLAAAVEWALAPEVGENGRISVRPLGIGGMSINSQGGQMSVAFSGYSLDLSPIRNPGMPSGTSAGPRSAQEQWVAESERNVTARLLFLVWDVATHPITLMILLLSVLIRVVLALARRSPG